MFFCVVLQMWMWMWIVTHTNSSGHAIFRFSGGFCPMLELVSVIGDNIGCRAIGDVMVVIEMVVDK